MQTPPWVERSWNLIPAPIRVFLDVLRDSRLMGLAAECAFWITFTLPWIALGAVSSVGLLAARIDPAAESQFQNAILTAASRVLTPDAVDSLLRPVIDQVAAGRADLTVVGLVIALWSGSRLVGALTQAVSVINGRPFHRGYASTRGIALVIYLVALIAVGLVVAVMAIGPDRLADLMGNPAASQRVLTSVSVGALVYGLVVLLYQLAAPRRAPIALDLVGAGVALAGWVLGSVGLRFYTDRLFSHFSIYSAVAAPIAILLWAYVTAIAVLGGAAVVVTLRRLRDPEFGLPGGVPAL